MNVEVAIVRALTGRQQRPNDLALAGTHSAHRLSSAYTTLSMNLSSIIGLGRLALKKDKCRSAAARLSSRACLQHSLYQDN